MNLELQLILFSITKVPQSDQFITKQMNKVTTSRKLKQRKLKSFLHTVLVLSLSGRKAPCYTEGIKALELHRPEFALNSAY